MDGKFKQIDLIVNSLTIEPNEINGDVIELKRINKIYLEEGMGECKAVCKVLLEELRMNRVLEDDYSINPRLRDFVTVEDYRSLGKFIDNYIYEEDLDLDLSKEDDFMHMQEYSKISRMKSLNFSTYIITDNREIMGEQISSLLWDTGLNRERFLIDICQNIIKYNTPEELHGYCMECMEDPYTGIRNNKHYIKLIEFILEWIDFLHEREDEEDGLESLKDITKLILMHYKVEPNQTSYEFSLITTFLWKLTEMRMWEEI